MKNKINYKFFHIISIIMYVLIFALSYYYFEFTMYEKIILFSTLLMIIFVAEGKFFMASQINTHFTDKLSNIFRFLKRKFDAVVIYTPLEEIHFSTENNIYSYYDLETHYLTLVGINERYKIIDLEDNIKAFVVTKADETLSNILGNSNLALAKITDDITTPLNNLAEENLQGTPYFQNFLYNNYFVVHDIEKEFYNYMQHIIDNTNLAVVAMDEQLNILLSSNNAKALLDNDVNNIFKQGNIKYFEKFLENTDKFSTFQFEINNNAYETTLIKPEINQQKILIKNKKIILFYIHKIEKIILDEKIVHSQRLQAIGQLSGGIAHDFNNLLTAMIGFCDLLLTKHGPGDRSFPEIMQIKQNANRAASLVRQLLAFSRKQTLQSQVIDITESLNEIAALIHRLIGNNINLKIYHGRNLWPVQVDVGQFEQVIINLCVNARDAMNGTGHLYIQTENFVIDEINTIPKEYIPPSDDEIISEGEYVQISIKDSGTGIPKEKIQKIFEPFYSTKEIGAGTGLGLAMVYGIIRQSGGYIYVHSEVGQGTEFIIFIPKAKKEAIETNLNQVEENNYKQTSTDLTGRGTILLIEDEDPVRLFASQALTMKGYEVIEAINAEDGRSIIYEKGKSIDLIISDVMMPGISGPNMIEEVSRQFSHLKVIFISGYGEDAFAETYGLYNRNFHFLPKPFNLKQLAEIVKEVLEQ